MPLALRLPSALRPEEPFARLGRLDELVARLGRSVRPRSGSTTRKEKKKCSAPIQSRGTPQIRGSRHAPPRHEFSCPPRQHPRPCGQSRFRWPTSPQMWQALEFSAVTLPPTSRWRTSSFSPFGAEREGTVEKTVKGLIYREHVLAKPGEPALCAQPAHQPAVQPAANPHGVVHATDSVRVALGASFPMFTWGGHHGNETSSQTRGLHVCKSETDSCLVILRYQMCVTLHILRLDNLIDSGRAQIYRRFWSWS